MSNDSIMALVAIITAIGSFLGSLAVYVTKIAKLELKCDTMWQAYLRRSISEGTDRGIGALGSPFKINGEVFQWFDGLANDLRDFYQKLNRPLISDGELALEIEQHFGDRILREVAMPHKLSQGASLLVATAVARGQTTFNLDDD